MDGRASRSLAADESATRGGLVKGQHKKSEGTPPGACRAARRPVSQARRRLRGLRLPVGPSYGEATQRRIRGPQKDHLHIAKMPYAAGYEGFSAASKQKRTRIICTLGPASWQKSASPHIKLCGRTAAPTAALRGSRRVHWNAPRGQPPQAARTHTRTRTPARPARRRDRRRIAGPSRC